MSIAPEKTIRAVEDFWQLLYDLEMEGTYWAKKLEPLTGWEACEFFIYVMLNQMQPEHRAWCAAEDCLKMLRGPKTTTFKTFWVNLANMNFNSLKRKLKFSVDNKYGYTGSYAGIKAKQFPRWLKKNANLIVEQYGVVENIWEDLPNDNDEEKIQEMHARFAKFNNIGKNLANMAVFILVRDHGYAGGVKSKKFLKIKHDTHVDRVLSNAIISGNPELAPVESYIQKLNENLSSPADFDCALYNIGKKYCQYNNRPDSKCSRCPIKDACNSYNNQMQ